MMTTNKAGDSASGKTTYYNDDGTTPRKSLGLYLHIPFCVRKCNYCDFLSFGDNSEEDHSAYIQALITEIRLYGKVYGKQYYVDSIFIGGGTPSLIALRHIEEIMGEVRACFTVDENAEITIESNPKTLTKEKLDTYLEAGINRLSLGAQSFDNKLLALMGRVHTAEDFLQNYTLARECGFQNINLDLMFGIPGQTMEIWRNTLEQAIGLEPEHVSFYSLQIEEGTPFFSMFREGALEEIEDELDRNMYHEALKLLGDRGYQHYEISNAARKGFECRHNLKYWSMKDYLGIGLGAHSFLAGTRHSNITDLNRYIKIGKENSGNEYSGETNSPFIHWRHENSAEESISEYLFTGMRKLDGVDLMDFEKRFGRPVEMVFSENWPALQKYIAEGYLVKTDQYMRFTIKGIDISNKILTEFV